MDIKKILDKIAKGEIKNDTIIGCNGFYHPLIVFKHIFCKCSFERN